jgi:hypothetical protein
VAHIAAVVCHPGDDEAEAGPRVEPLVHESKLRRVVADGHGGERRTEAAATGV